MEASTIIAMGLTTGQISQNGKGYIFDDKVDQPIYLGKSLEDIRASIVESYPLVVSLYREFLLRLSNKAFREAVTSTNFIEIASNSSNGQLAQQLGEKSFIQTQEIANALMPYVKRLPLHGTSRS